MGSLQKAEGAGVGIEFYKWVLGTLSMSRARGGGYRRLNPPVRKRVRLARLGKRRLKSFKMKRLPRLRLSWFSPFTLLARLRDAYVHLLQAASDKLALSEGLSLAPFPAISHGSSPVPFGDFKAKDEELNKVLQLYLARTRTQLVLTNDD